MKFKSLKLNNFRQYIGDNYIEFGTTNDQNVTLIFGANGFGKTGIFRAIMFALYGDSSLKQDNLPSNKGLILVNEKILEQNINEKIKASVIIEFEDNNKVYVLSRSIIAQKIDHQSIPVQEQGEVSLKITENSNTKPPIKDHDEIATHISSIINKKIRDFFLFDGEQMEELTKYSNESRKEVKKGIKNLLQLDSIEIAQESLKKCIKSLNDQIEVNSSGELEIVSEKITACADKISINENNLEDLNTQIQISDDDEKKIRQKIDENKDALEKQREMDNIKKQVKKSEETLDEEVINLKELLEVSGSYIGVPAITELYTELNLKKEKGELPSGVREEFIDKLLNECRCICGTNLHEDTQARELLIGYKQQRNNSLSDAAMKVHNLTLELKIKMEHTQKEYETSTHRYNKYQEEYNLLNKKLEDLDEELKGIKPVQNLAERLQQIKNDRRRYINEQGQLDNQLIKLKSDLEKFKKDQETLSANNLKAQMLIKQRDLVDSSIDELKEIYNEYSDELRINLSKCATEIFHKIADQNSLKSLASIIISDDFQLEVLSHSGTKMLSQISSGQRQIVSLAYICALLQVGNDLEMPLLMDTPFGRLSGSPRDACLKELPNLLSQWILLATDTEFQKEEASSLRASGKWGNVYEIDNIEDRESQILKKDINHWQPQRRTR